MSRPQLERSDDVAIYLVLNDYGKLGSAYVETDPGEADRESIIRNFLSGQYDNAVRSSPSIPPKAGPGTCPRTSRVRSCSEPRKRAKIWARIPSVSSTGMSQIPRSPVRAQCKPARST
jgi:hypothetical protein